MLRQILCFVVWWTVASASLLRADEAEDKSASFVVKIGGKVIRNEKQLGKPVVLVSLPGEVTDSDLKGLGGLNNLSTRPEPCWRLLLNRYVEQSSLDPQVPDLPLTGSFDLIRDFGENGIDQT